jgi:hypothetical protein
MDLFAEFVLTNSEKPDNLHTDIYSRRYVRPRRAGMKPELGGRLLKSGMPLSSSKVRIACQSLLFIPKKLER